MKKLLLLATVLIVSVGLFAQTQAPAKPEVVKFKEIKYDFGKIKQAVPATHDFIFTNVSDAPVVIESTVASCGCTTPVKPEGAIPKGKTEKITASYNAAAVGPFNKTITVKIAGQDQPIQLNIVGEVLTADAYAKYASEKQKTVKTGS
jgi:hypothetical protein